MRVTATSSIISLKVPTAQARPPAQKFTLADSSLRYSHTKGFRVSPFFRPGLLMTSHIWDRKNREERDRNRAPAQVPAHQDEGTPPPGWIEEQERRRRDIEDANRPTAPRGSVDVSEITID